MKRIILFLGMLLMGFGIGFAQQIVLKDVNITKGGKSNVVVELNNEAVYYGFQFELTLPDGITCELNEKGKIVVAKGERLSASHSIGTSYDRESNVYTFTCIDITDGERIQENSGELISFSICADETVNESDVLIGQLKGITLTGEKAVSTDIGDVSFNIIIGENRILLDEESTTMPEAASNVSVKVKRTIPSNEWNTICLPFSLTVEQVKAVFGSDVQLKDFNGYAVEENSVGEITGIKVKFKDATSLEANHPYVIRVGKSIAEFDVDGVDIEPKEEPLINLGTTRKPKSFVGVYKANTKLKSGTLFLSNNKFWYSMGKTKIKAYRGYFDFYDTLQKFDDADAASSKVSFAFSENNSATGINLIGDEGEAFSVWYNMIGQRVEYPTQKGLYIVNGKKIVKK